MKPLPAEHGFDLVNAQREAAGVVRFGLEVKCRCGWSCFFHDERAAVRFALESLCPLNEEDEDVQS